jgi:hypothetical protein
MRIICRRTMCALAAATSAACSHEITSPDPSLATMTPDLVCIDRVASTPDGATTVTLGGSGFTPMPSRTLDDPRELVLPTITLTPTGGVPGVAAPSAAFDIADDPANPGASRVRWTSETSMSFDVVPTDMLPAGVYDVTVTNHDGTRASTFSDNLALLPPPVITGATPMAVCDDQEDQIVEITGTSFLFLDGASPNVTIVTNDGPLTYPATPIESSCAAIPGGFAEANVRLCTSLSFTVPQGDIVVTTSTMFDLVVTNPAPADCASSTAFDITFNPPPSVDSVVPSTVCAGGAQLTINGRNFQAGATVALVCNGVTIEAANVTVNESGAQISATFGGGAPAGESCAVVVTNPDGCEDRPLPHKTVSVSTGPIVFHVDPSVVYNGINTRITIYATTISTPLPSDAVQVRMGATVTTLQFNTVAGRPNRLQAIVPASQAPGVYDVLLRDSLECPSTLPGALTVTDTTTVALREVIPPFGFTAEDTAVTIFRDTSAAAPNDHPFVATPRVFLNPNNPTATDVAATLEAVTFLDGDRVTGVVPAGTPANLYDVVLVNPDGSVGVLSGGYRSTSTPPPRIDAVTPASIVGATGQVVTLSGTDFGAGNVVTLTCRTPTNTTVMPLVVTGTPSCTGSSCTEQITINASTVPEGSICVVRLTNADGAYGEFSAIGVTNPSLNLGTPVAGPLLTVGRRALSAAAGDATFANRFVYAIGGDSGTTAGALDSVESAPVDLFGTVGAYAAQRHSLRAPRTLAGAATIGRYVYLVGGNNGTGQVATAERALILSPREVPQITDIDLQLEDVGLEAGDYRYRVSAVFDAADAHNPGGETLAGDELSVRVPSFPGQRVALTVVWDAPVDSLGVALPNVVGYRIYRTARDGASGTEVLYATVGATPRTFTDDGTATPGTDTPLPLGSTGRWAALPDLGSAREGLAVTAAADPATPGVFHVYALLGRSNNTTVLSSYEYLTVTVAANGRHSVGASWTAGLLPSGQARWQLGAWTVDRTVSPDYTGATTYVFLGGGMSATGMLARRRPARQHVARQSHDARQHAARLRADRRGVRRLRCQRPAVHIRRRERDAEHERGFCRAGVTAAGSRYGCLEQRRPDHDAGSLPARQHGEERVHLLARRTDADRRREPDDRDGDLVSLTTKGPAMRTILCAFLLAMPAVAAAETIEPAARKETGLLAGAKIGGIVPLDGLSPFPHVGVEVGYVLPPVKRQLAIVIGADYTQPTATGEETDPRVTGGRYTWKLVEQELGVQATLVFRARAMKPVAPYAGIGPRVLFTRSKVSDDGMPTISTTTEQSMRLGVAIPAGVELPLGPGSAIAEVLLQYGTLDHVATGDAHTGAITLAAGYRLTL